MGNQGIDLSNVSGYASNPDSTKMQQKRTIMIDVGHGGADSGAKAKNGTQTIFEKDVNLVIAKKLGEILRQNGYKVVFTRLEDNFDIEGDLAKQGYNVKFEKDESETDKRASARDQVNPDFFLCLHANHSSSSAVKGVEAYYFSNSNFAKWLKGTKRNKPSKEALANYKALIKQESELKKPQNIDFLTLQQRLAAKNRLLAQTIQDDFQKVTGEATSIQEKDNKVLENNYSQIREHNIMDNVAVPSALIEIGYLSNPKDRKKILDENYQQKIAQGLAQGIIDADKLIKKE